MISELNFEIIWWHEGVICIWIATKLDRELLIKEIEPYSMKVIHIRKDMKVISKILVTNWVWKTEEKEFEYY